MAKPMSVLKTGTIVLILGTAACASHEIRYVPMQCPDIPRPELPVINDPGRCEQREEVGECLSDDSWFSIEKRDLLLRQYAEEHEQACQTFEDLAREAE